jgi:hypothetical protein
MYELALEGGGMSMKRTIPEDLALQIISVVMGGDGGSAPAGSRIVAPRRQVQGSGNLTVGEFIAQSQAVRNPDKIAAIGAFLTDHLAQETFSRDEVKAQFQHAGETPPGNFARDFNVAISSKWIAQAQGKAGEFFVTNTGRQAIDQHFPQEVRRARKSGARKARKKSTAANS